ncbi:MAG: hypothetical protein GY696_00870, partial [Gammaproteobacteria bacterium]|nr:hypothetical protein [Gammaproteobacteria bacterium]
MREKVFNEHPDTRPDLTTVLRLMTSDERAFMGIKQMKQTTRPEILSDNVQKLQRTPPQSKAPSSTETGSRNCLSCGKPGHSSSKDESCPAKGKVCNHCKMVGHFDTVCWKKNPEMMPRHFFNKSKPGPKARIIRQLGSLDARNEENADVLADVTFSSGETKAELSLNADSGSDVTIIPWRFYKRHFRKMPLEEVSRPISNYDGSKIRSDEVKGRLPLKVSLNGRTVEATVHVLSRHEPILGKKEMKKLGVQFDWENDKVRTVKLDMGMIEAEFPRLFSSEIGKVPNFQHHIHLTPNAIPMAKKLRNFPIAVEPLISNELDKLEAQGIISLIDKSEWVHSIIAAKKKDSSDVRICADMTSLNPYIIQDQFALPNMKEILSKLSGSKVFLKLDIRKVYWHIELAPKSRPLTA